MNKNVYIKECKFYDHQIKKFILNPCPKCGSINLEMKDCGYSTFNCGHVKCLDCEYFIELNNLDWNKEIAYERLRNIWNTIVSYSKIKSKDEIIKILRKQLEDNNIKPII